MCLVDVVFGSDRKWDGLWISIQDLDPPCTASTAVFEAVTTALAAIVFPGLPQLFPDSPDPLKSPLPETDEFIERINNCNQALASGRVCNFCHIIGCGE